MCEKVKGVPYALKPRMRIAMRSWISRRENQKILLPKKSILSDRMDGE